METCHGLGERKSSSLNFDTSYKGWKPLWRGYLKLSLPHFDTSYKGWKPRHAEDPPCQDRISILPIRDGNCSNKMTPSQIPRISILPIRDGNLSGGSISIFAFAISILPIRDGNSLPTGFAYLLLIHFDTSYKGWKPCHCSSLHLPEPHFDTSYKGWKPRQGTQPVLLSRRFRYFL